MYKREELKMAKAKTVFVCSDCGYESPKWLGKCPACNSWNTFYEEKLQTTSHLCKDEHEEKFFKSSQGSFSNF